LDNVIIQNIKDSLYSVIDKNDKNNKWLVDLNKKQTFREANDKELYRPVTNTEKKPSVALSFSNDPLTNENIEVFGHFELPSEFVTNSDGQTIFTNSKKNLDNLWDALITESTALINGTSTYEDKTFPPNKILTTNDPNDNTNTLLKYAKDSSFHVAKQQTALVATATTAAEKSKYICRKSTGAGEKTCINTIGRAGYQCAWDKTTSRCYAGLKKIKY